MALEDRTLKICNCNKTMALDAKALERALKLGRPIQMHAELCRKEVGSFQEALKDEACLVACTQEAPLFAELAESAKSQTRLEFVNIREHAGWSKEGAKATPKIAALLALAELPEPEALPGVSYRSGGQLLIVGPAAAAIAWADKLAESAKSQTRLEFVNIREHAGWSKEGAKATPKIAALLALAELPEPEALPGVSYRSGGQLLIVGPAAAAIAWADKLAGRLDVSVLITDTRGGELPDARRYPVFSGAVKSIKGHLGAFELAWEQANPVDLEVCTRCNACIRACPEQAIDFTYQIDLDKCKSHRECVKACGAIGAIDFDRMDRARSERFDMVLDLSAQALIRTPQPPQGYLAPGSDPLEQALAAAQLGEMVGEFEKPRFFAYDARICAHSRSSQTGCNQCLEVCSTGAITPDGDHVKVDPHLCMGCGGCATVCPSGAMSHAYPRVPDLGARLKRVLSVYAQAGGEDACLLFHNAGESRALIARLARRGRGLPARVIPLEIHHPASIGMDLLLAAIAYGASQVAVLAEPKEAAEYGAALNKQMGFAESIVSGLGYGGAHFRLLATDDHAALEKDLWALAPSATISKAATYNLSAEKRTTLDFAIDHLAKLAPKPQDVIALAAGAPFGQVVVDKQTCTLCMACVGACPESALVDGRDRPMLKFIERNCVQCGLCEATCPEDAIELVPRLLLTAQAKQEVALNEAEPFNCVRCGKPFGTRKMVENMLGKLTGHSMFPGAGSLKRLQMCADCRVVDMMENKDEMNILDVKR